MKTDFADYLSQDSVVVIEGETKRDALEELIRATTEKTSLVDHDQLEKAVWKREQMITTGVGQGLAIPHVRMAALTQPIILIGVPKKPVKDYQSLDNKPVKLLVFIAAPEGNQDEYLKLLGSVSAKLKDSDVIEQVIACGTKTAQVLKILKKK